MNEDFAPIIPEETGIMQGARKDTGSATYVLSEVKNIVP